MATPSGLGAVVMVAVARCSGKATSRLKFVGLIARSCLVVRETGPVDVPFGTRAVNAVAPALSVGAGDLLNESALSSGRAPRFVPAIVTSESGDPAGGFTKSMRGPPGLATCTPVSVPWPEFAGWVQMPEAVRSARLSAVNVQLFSAHGDRSIVPVMLLFGFAAPERTPSMQSISPRSVAL